MSASTVYQHVALPGVNLEPQEARRVIDAEIRVHYESIQRLQAARNCYAPISRLPVEVIARIFVFLQTASADDREASSSPLEWIRVTHVCRQWRNIALDFSELWTVIPFDHPKWVSGMLARSKMSDLVFEANLGYDPYGTMEKDPESFELLKVFFQEHLSRARRITLANVEHIKQLESLFLPLKSTPVPRLQVLEIIAPSLDGSVKFDPIGVLERVLTDTANLKKLDIYFASRWDTKLFTGLTHLTIRWGFAPKPQAFLMGLAHMTSLQHLHLDDMLPQAGQEASIPSNVPSVSLPDLTALELSDSANQILWFLDNVQISNKARLALTCHALPSEINKFLEVVSRVVVHFNAVPSLAKQRKIASAQMEIDQDFLQLDFWEDSRHMEAPGGEYLGLPEDVAFVSLMFDWSSEDARNVENTRQVTSSTWNAFPCHDLQVLSLHLGSAAVDEEELFCIIGPQPNLQSLYLDNHSLGAYYIVNFLTASAKLPALRFLNVKDIYLDKISMEAFETFLLTRRAANCGLTHLHFQEARNRTKQDHRKLEKLVRDFSWRESTPSDYGSGSESGSQDST